MATTGESLASLHETMRGPVLEPRSAGYDEARVRAAGASLQGMSETCLVALATTLCKACSAST
jgi:hypothetical protein